MNNIGFIGLGIMGKHMAKNLIKAGYSLMVFDIRREAVEELELCGATAAASTAEIAVSCDTIVTMLPNSPHVKAVVLEKEGIIDHANPGTLVIDMSSIAPAASKEMQTALAAKGIRMLDAPVSGGEPKAIDGSLAIMVGGEPSDYEQAKPLFDVLGSTAVLVGPIGSGNTCKLVNQVIVALNIAALSEGLMLAQMSGTDPKKVFSAIQSGLAGSTVMNAKTPMILDRDFKPGFRIDLHIKDLNNALDTGYEVGAQLPLTAVAAQMMYLLHSEGMGREDHSALVKYYEKLCGTQVSKGTL